MRSNKTVSLSRLKPPVVTPPDVLRPKTRSGGLDRVNPTGVMGTAVTIPGSVTMRATVG